jgi:hypothetical protein
MRRLLIYGKKNYPLVFYRTRNYAPKGKTHGRKVTELLNPLILWNTEAIAYHSNLWHALFHVLHSSKGAFPPSHFSNKLDDKLAHKVALQTNVTHFCLVCQSKVCCKPNWFATNSPRQLCEQVCHQVCCKNVMVETHLYCFYPTTLAVCLSRPLMLSLSRFLKTRALKHWSNVFKFK